MVSEAKDHAIARLDELGMHFTVAHGITPDIKAVPKAGQGYYTQEPRPKLLLIDIEYVAERIEKPLLSTAIVS